MQAFCDQVQHELMTLLNEKASLWEEVERLRRRIIDSGDPPVAPARRTPTSRPSGSCRTPSRWQTGTWPMRRSTAVSSPRTPGASRDEVLTEAKTHADRVLDEAHSRASRAAEVVASEPGSAGQRGVAGSHGRARLPPDVQRGLPHPPAGLPGNPAQQRGGLGAVGEVIAGGGPGRAALPVPLPGLSRGTVTTPGLRPVAVPLPGPVPVPRTRPRTCRRTRPHCPTSVLDPRPPTRPPPRPGCRSRGPARGSARCRQKGPGGGG